MSFGLIAWNAVSQDRGISLSETHCEIRPLVSPVIRITSARPPMILMTSLAFMAESLDISIRQVKNNLNHSLEICCSNAVMDKRQAKYENRRKRLRRLIEERADGNQAAFGRMYGYERSQISQYLSATYNKGRSPGGNVIDDLEEKLGLPPGWFDIDDNGRAIEWPFTTISPERYAQTTDAQRAAIEEWLRDQLDRFLGQEPPDGGRKVANL